MGSTNGIDKPSSSALKKWLLGSFHTKRQCLRFGIGLEPIFKRHC